MKGWYLNVVCVHEKPARRRIPVRLEGQGWWKPLPCPAPPGTCCAQTVHMCTCDSGVSISFCVSCPAFQALKRQQCCRQQPAWAPRLQVHALEPGALGAVLEMVVPMHLLPGVCLATWKAPCYGLNGLIFVFPKFLGSSPNPNVMACGGGAFRRASSFSAM